MKRKEFINFALLAAAAHHLPFPATQEELFRFEFSSVAELLKKVPATEQVTAILMIKNLLYDMEYLFKQVKGKTDLTTLKKLAEEADRKFYAENKLKGKSFGYQPFTISKLEDAKRNTSLKPGEFDTMLKTIKYYSNKIRTSGEKFEKLIPSLLKEADQAAQKQKEAEDKGECQKVLSVIAAVIIVVVAVVVATFTFGAGAGLVALAVIAAAAIIGAAFAASKGTLDGVLMGAMIGASLDTLTVGVTTISIEKEKISWGDFDKRIKCAFLSVVNAMTTTIFSPNTYPSRAIMGSVAVNIFGITNKIPGIEMEC